MDGGALQGFLTMGGYGAFVWPAYGLSLLVLGGLLLAARQGLKRQERLSAEQERLKGRRR